MQEPVWLTRQVVEALHEDQIRAHGGQSGLRDEGLLESALARPLQRSGYEPESDLASLAADYGFGLAKNHAFMDGNKRIAFVAMGVLLIINGSEIDAPEPEVVATMLAVAAGHLDRDGLAAWIRSRLRPYPP